MTRKQQKTVPALAAVLVVGSLLASCAEGGGQEEGDADSSSSAKPHGYVEGAEEAAEQQSRLVLRDGGTGAVSLLDLVEEDTRKLGRAKDASGMSTDGRFAYVGSPNGTEVFDGGSWMVDHGDHVHYYRAKAKDVGGVGKKEAEHVFSSPSLTALSFADGTARLLDRARMEKGKLRTTAVLKDARKGPVVPYEDVALVPVSGSGGGTVVEVRDTEGRKKEQLAEKCADLRGAAVTRRGVVFGCADGALFVSGKTDGELEAEKIPFPDDVEKEERPGAFSHRSLGTTLAAKAGDKGAWLLDVTERRWKRVDSGPVVAVNTAGEGAPLLALDRSGTLTSYDAESGEELASRKVLRKPARKGSEPTIEVDANRAYVNDVAARKIYEIDYADDLRRARTFPLDFAPTDMVETGR
ncbi:hypothetical protein [Streptomyces xiaopingdaonensis]|uniref:hypothetical protein n=1 Tax=Streptomyces xiaopingdaonensis TaxID=1565415 RepID=UPI0004940DA4|nr:hypothetical protein [Streptomyces xiaopingdaonensis]